MLRKHKPKTRRRLAQVKHEAPGSNPGPSIGPFVRNARPRSHSSKSSTKNSSPNPFLRLSPGAAPPRKPAGFLDPKIRQDFLGRLKSLTKNDYSLVDRSVAYLKSIIYKQAPEPVLQDAAKFIFLLAFFSASIYFLFGLFSVHQYFSLAAGYVSVPILTTLGVHSTLIPTATIDGFPSIVGTANGTQFTAELGQLCGGGLELAILCGSVLASRDRSLRDRLKGILLGFLVEAIFNPLRISITLTTVGTSLLPTIHDVLFRALLVIVLVGAYALWYLNTKTLSEQILLVHKH